jgi:hypothetical protein
MREICYTHILLRSHLEEQELIEDRRKLSTLLSTNKQQNASSAPSLATQLSSRKLNSTLRASGPKPQLDSPDFPLAHNSVQLVRSLP